MRSAATVLTALLMLLSASPAAAETAAAAVHQTAHGQEIWEQLTKLYAQRQLAKGFAFSPDNEWQAEFEERFDYDETEDQLRSIVRGYVTGLFDSLRAHGYDSRMMPLYIMGGGGCLVKNFGVYDKESVIFIDDLHASAKGYEYMAELQIKAGQE